MSMPFYLVFLLLGLSINNSNIILNIFADDSLAKLQIGDYVHDDYPGANYNSYNVPGKQGDKITFRIRNWSNAVGLFGNITIDNYIIQINENRYEFLEGEEGDIEIDTESWPLSHKKVLGYAKGNAKEDNINGVYYYFYYYIPYIIEVSLLDNQTDYNINLNDYLSSYTSAYIEKGLTDCNNKTNTAKEYDYYLTSDKYNYKPSIKQGVEIKQIWLNCTEGAGINCTKGYFYFIIKRADQNCIYNGSLTADEIVNCDGICDSGYYSTPDDYGIACRICDENCTECEVNEYNCTICKDNLYKKENDSSNYCYLLEDGYYLNNSIITKCDISCSKCYGTKYNCSICAENYLKKENDNSNYCYLLEDGYYLNNSIISKCDISCSKCYGTNYNCTECKDNYYRIENDTSGECFNFAKEGYYFDENEFKKCDLSCKICEGSKNNCTLCAENYYNKENDTSNNCYQIENGYYLDNTILKKCNESCFTCNSSSGCLKCNDGYYKIEEDTDNICYNVIKDGYYLDNDIIRKCNNSCLACEGSSINCTSCNDGYYKIEDENITDNICYFSNITGFYLKNNTLKKCDISCKACLNDNKNCILCNDHFYKKENASSNECFNLSPGFYLDNNKINKCDNSCLICEGEPLNCTICQENFYRMEGDNTSKCYNYIENGYYLDNQTIKKCNESCLTCDISPNNCTKCKDNKYKREDDTLYLCYDVTSGYYLNNQIIKKCNESCMECEGDSLNCTICQKYFYRMEGDNTSKCYNYIENGYYLDNQTTIKKCNESCLACEGEPLNCTICQENFYRMEGDNTSKCYNYIENGYYLDNQTIKKCNESCLACDISPNNCTKCKDNKYKREDDTLNLCYDVTSGYYLDNQIIKKCNESCIECEGDPLNCTKCQINYIKGEDNRCYKKNSNSCDDKCFTCITSQENCKDSYKYMTNLNKLENKCLNIQNLYNIKCNSNINQIINNNCNEECNNNIFKSYSGDESSYYYFGNITKILEHIEEYTNCSLKIKDSDKYIAMGTSCDNSFYLYQSDNINIDDDEDSSINLNQCLDILSDYYNNDKFYISKIINNNNKNIITKEIKFNLYDENGDLVDISKCEEENTYITIKTQIDYINYNFTDEMLENLLKLNSLKNEMLKNECSQNRWNKNSPIIKLNTLNICQEGCEYIKQENDNIFCNCSASSSLLTYQTNYPNSNNNIFDKIIKKMNNLKNNFYLFKCYEIFKQKDIKININLYICLCLIFLTIIMFFYPNKVIDNINKSVNIPPVKKNSTEFMKSNRSNNEFYDIDTKVQKSKINNNTILKDNSSFSPNDIISKKNVISFYSAKFNLSNLQICNSLFSNLEDYEYNFFDYNLAIMYDKTNNLSQYLSRIYSEKYFIYSNLCKRIQIPYMPTSLRIIIFLLKIQTLLFFSCFFLFPKYYIKEITKYQEKSSSNKIIIEPAIYLEDFICSIGLIKIISFFLFQKSQFGKILVSKKLSSKFANIRFSNIYSNKRVLLFIIIIIFHFLFSYFSVIFYQIYPLFTITIYISLLISYLLYIIIEFVLIFLFGTIKYYSLINRRK